MPFHSVAIQDHSVNIHFSCVWLMPTHGKKINLIIEGTLYNSNSIFGINLIMNDWSLGLDKESGTVINTKILTN